MTETKTNITYRVLTDTERKLAVLARRNFRKPGAALDLLISEAWQTAKEAGFVTDAMLENATVTTLPRPDGAQAVTVVSISARA